MESLEHVLAGVAHAKKHVDNFESVAAAYMRGNPCKLVVEYGFGPAQHIHKAKWLKPIPVELSHICFDAINNLRSALDQAGYAVAVAVGKSGSRAHFPFGDSEAVLANDWAAGIGPSKEIPKELFHLMLRFKPYPGGDNALLGMNQLCNGSKHEIIRPMAIGLGNFSAALNIPGLVHEAAIPPVWNGKYNEMVFMRTAVDSQAQYQFKFAPFIAINNTANFVGGQEAVAFLRHLVGKVESIVLALEAEARRVGIFK